MCFFGKKFTPEEILNHPIVTLSWEGIDASQFLDVHVHLVGEGIPWGKGAYKNINTGCFVNPKMKSYFHPLQLLAYKSYLKASGADPSSLDESYVYRMAKLMNDFPKGAKLLLLAFDRCHDEYGKPNDKLSPIYVPNQYAWHVAKQFSDKFDWAASVHPYREDVEKELEWCKEKGAKAVKWLPPVMGIDPASNKCDRFYKAMSDLNIPLLTHGGEERALHGGGTQESANPQHMYRALDAGVKVIIAHCACFGKSKDLETGLPENNFVLFKNFLKFVKSNQGTIPGSLTGDLSGITLFNRSVWLEKIVNLVNNNPDTHFLNGSDYPLPGVPLFIHLRTLAKHGYINKKDIPILNALRKHNPLLFDFVLKRQVKNPDGSKLRVQSFETKRFFEE